MTDAVTLPKAYENERWNPATGVYTLEFPAVFKSKIAGSPEIIERVVGDITIRRPNGADIRAADAFKGSDTATGLFMMQRLTGGGSELIDALDAADIEEVGEIIDSFRKPGRTTGGTS